MRRSGVLIAAVLIACVPLATPAAFACSRIRIISPAEALSTSQGAFVGVLISQADAELPGNFNAGVQEVKYTFLVEWAVKGAVTRRLDAFGAKQDCGAGIPRGKRIGLTLNRDGIGWFADSGDLQDPDELLAAAPKGSPVRLGSLGLAERLWTRLQTFPAKPAVGLVLAFLVTFVIAVRADRRRLRIRPGSVQPAP